MEPQNPNPVPPQPMPPSTTPAPPASPDSSPSQLPPAPPPVQMPRPTEGLPPATPGAGQVITGGFDPMASSLPGTVPPTPPAASGSSLPPMPPTSGMVVGSTDPASMPPSPPSQPRRSLKPLLIVLVAALVLVGGSAAAYVAVILPNKPANVLKAAFINTLEQKQVSTSGTASTGGGAFKTSFSTATDLSSKTMQAKMNMTFSGVNFPIEARYVQQNFYFKVGDLTTITSLLGAFSPNAGNVAQALNTQVANKWIVVDSTLIDEDPTLKCVLNTDWGFTNADIKLLGTQYGKHPFTTIKSATSSTVAGRPAEKFALSLDDNAFNNFGNGLTKLSMIKNFQKCPGFTNTSADTASLPSQNKPIPLTVWVDKGSKRIVQVASQVGGSGSVTVTLSYGPVHVDTPSNAEPVLQLIGALESATGGSTDLSQLLNSGSTTN